MSTVIEPYYEEPGITIYHGDCRDILPHLPKVDLVLTDPPYGNGTQYGTYIDTAESLTALIAEVYPLIRNISPVALITPGIANLWKWPEPTWVLAWYSPAGESASRWGFGCWQPVLAYGVSPHLSRGLGRRPDAFIFDRPSPKYNHPCPKPIEVMRQLLARGTTAPGETVLDPLMGSGATLVAAKQLGRKAIGIEIEKKYCDIAIERLRQGVLPL